MPEDVLVGRKNAEDEHRVTGPIADEIRAGRHAKHLAIRVVRSDDSGDVRPVPAARIAVVVGSLIDRHDDLLSRPQARRFAVDDFHVVCDALHQIRVRRVDAGVDDGDAHAASVNAERLHLVGADGVVGGHRVEFQPLVWIHVGRETISNRVVQRRARAPQERQRKMVETLHAKSERSQGVERGGGRRRPAERGDAVDRSVRVGRCCREKRQSLPGRAGRGRHAHDEGNEQPRPHDSFEHRTSWLLPSSISRLGSVARNAPVGTG